jgi:mono/diheme cytochrome c family protein
VQLGQQVRSVPQPLASALSIAIALSITSGAASAASPGSNVPDVLTRRSGLTLAPMPHAAQLYATNCQGCHGEIGSSAAEIPTLAGRVGYFTRIPEGRRYLVQVPNVALNANSDADIAAVLNWLLATYSRAQLAPDFQPYTASEVGQLRQARIDVALTRRRVIDALVAAGQIPSANVLALPLIVLY